MGDRWIFGALEGVLPEETFQLLHDHVMQPNTPFQIFWRQLVLWLRQAFDIISPLVLPLVDRAMTMLNDSPDLVVLGVLLALFLLVLQLAFYMHRLMMFWTRLAMRMVMWAVVFGIVAVVWQRGPEAALRDIVVVFSKMAGYAAILKDIWLREYDRYSEQATSGNRGSDRQSRRGGW